MRHSRYVVEVAGPEGQSLLYNTANGAFVQLGEDAKFIWSDGADRINVEHDGDAEGGGIVAQLVDSGFLTTLSPEEERNLLHASFQQQRRETREMAIAIIPTYACNYCCPYCYEIGHQSATGKMDGPMMDRLADFLRDRHGEDGFQSLKVEWYGGEPTLALDVVEELTGKLTAWCAQEGIAYDAMMLTNANLIGEEEAQLIADCHISSALFTIDGPQEIHDRRRVAADGSDSYQRTIQAARYLRARGVRISANMNADKVNLPLYADLREQLLEEAGIELSFGKLNDYGHFYGTASFCKPDFDLFTHEEFFQAQFQEFAKLPHTAAELREMLRPVRRFCAGQADNYFVIDLLGNVYKCDGWVGDEGYVIFNLWDDPATWKLHEVSFDPTQDERCGDCELLPLCWGNCYWERVLSDLPCHPFKTTMGDYLRVYYQCLTAEANAVLDETGAEQGETSSSEGKTKGVTLLATPF